LLRLTAHCVHVVVPRMASVLHTPHGSQQKISNVQKLLPLFPLLVLCTSTYEL
jgi:hypothetical protein